MKLSKNKKIEKMFFLALLIGVAGALAFSISFVLGIGIRYRTMNDRTQEKDFKDRPTAVARVVSAESPNRIDRDSFAIVAFNDLYASIGVTSADFTRWENKYGMDSLGTAMDGELFVPGYPVLSKIAWMHIDSVTLTSEQTRALIEECDQAKQHAVNESAKREFAGISELARKALNKDEVIRFEPPWG